MRLALLLRDAADDGELLALLLQPLVVVQPVEDLLLGLIADGAGVVEDQVGLVHGLHLAVALADERARDLLGVMEVHLTAEGLNEKRLGLLGAQNSGNLLCAGCHRRPFGCHRLQDNPVA